MVFADQQGRLQRPLTLSHHHHRQQEYQYNYNENNNNENKLQESAITPSSASIPHVHPVHEPPFHEKPHVDQDYQSSSTRLGVDVDHEIPIDPSLLLEAANVWLSNT